MASTILSISLTEVEALHFASLAIRTLPSRGRGGGLQGRLCNGLFCAQKGNWTNKVKFAKYPAHPETNVFSFVIARNSV